MESKVSVIIPNFNGERLIGGCLDSLLAQTLPPDRVIVVDNGSTDRSQEIVRKHPLVPVLVELPENPGFAAAVNRGLMRADTDVIALLNNDAEADPGWLEAGLAALRENPGAAMIASLMLDYHDHDKVDSAGDLYPRDGRPRPRGRGEPVGAFTEPAEVWSACAGAAFYQKSLLDELSGFEDSFFAYLEDVDLGFRARARGHRCLFAPGAMVYHRGAATELGDQAGQRPYDSSLRVQWIARNRIRVIARNWPPGLVLRFFPWLAFGFLKSAAYHLFVSGQGRAFLQGIGEGVGKIGEDRKQRAAMASQETLEDIPRLMREGARRWRA